MTAPSGLTTLPFQAHPLRTERLLLRPLTEADVDDVYAYQSLPDVVRFLPWNLRDRDESREHTGTRAGFTTLAQNADGLIFAVQLVGEDGTTGPVIGDLSLFLTSADNAQVEIGWVFHPDYQHQGFATEASRALLGLAFDEIGAHRVIARVDPRNVASVALCQRLSMRLEGLFIENEIFKGEWTDLAVYAILRREWEGTR